MTPTSAPACDPWLRDLVERLPDRMRPRCCCTTTRTCPIERGRGRAAPASRHDQANVVRRPKQAARHAGGRGMTNLPRRPIEPLTPPPDSFDRVFAGAAPSPTAAQARGRVHRRWRRWRWSPSAPSRWARRSTQRSGSTRRARLTTNPSPTAAPTTADHRPRNPGVQEEPHGGRRRKVGCRRPVTELAAAAGPSTRRRRASLASTFCRALRGPSDSAGWSNARTDAGGYFSIPCPHAPVLLVHVAPQRALLRRQRRRANWAATFVGSNTGTPVVPRCGGHAYTTTLVPGATVTGTGDRKRRLRPGRQLPRLALVPLPPNHGHPTARPLQRDTFTSRACRPARTCSGCDSR